MSDDWQSKYRMIGFSRRGRVLTITLNNPDSLNVINKVLHDELATVFTDVAFDEDSDVIVLTGAGRAFSAGGDIGHMQSVVDNPDLFIHEAEMARRIVFSLLDLQKPIIARINGHAVGLGATLALFCDVTFMSERAKIGDPHVAIGLVAGDGGAVIWPQLVGFNRAKEYLMTGELLDAATAERIGLVNHVVAVDELDAKVDAFCDKLVNGSTRAIRWTKSVVNMELKRIADALMPAGLSFETVSAHSTDHAEAVRAFRDKRPPVFRT